MIQSTELTDAAATYDGFLAMLSPFGEDAGLARRRALYRATLTADLLERGEVGEMARWDGAAAVVISPSAETSIAFETPAAAARFVRCEIVPRLAQETFDADAAAAEFRRAA